MEQEVRQRWSRKEIYIGVLAILATIGLCVAGVYYKDELMSTTYLPQGIPACFATATVRGSTIKPYSGMLVSDSYLTWADHNRFPDNMCMVGLNLQVIEAFLTHFAGSAFSKRKKSNIKQKLTTEIFDVEYAKGRG